MIGTIKNAAKQVMRRVNANDIDAQIRLNVIQRPNYAYILLQSARLAKRLGMDRISALEFGVAGGRGIVAMAEIAREVHKATGVSIEIYGFDTGEGLPPPIDHRDLPYIWQEAHFKMDREKLQAQLGTSTLVIGNVADTISGFVSKYNPAPIGAISFDLDYYSSTRDAFRIFDIDADHKLPRIFCYFDDIYSTDIGHVGPFVGVPLAIDEFNVEHADAKLMPLNHLEFEYRRAHKWHRQIYSYSDFAHARHNSYIVGEDRQLAI